MNRPANEPVADVARRVRASAPRLGDVRLVVVDGPAGSGKTTYADAVSVALDGAPVVHMDDLYEGWAGLEHDVWARLDEQVLEPLRAGRTARYQVYDWFAARFDAWVDVPTHDALVVEGVGSAARATDPWAVLRVWVEVPRPLRLARGLARDGKPLQEQWERWADLEDRHFAADGTRGRADIVVDGTARI